MFFLSTLMEKMDSWRELLFIQFINLFSTRVIDFSCDEEASN